MAELPAETEVLVIGGGPGGYVAAIRAGQLGHDTVLVEREGVGGVCLNHGCIPSKALLDTTGTVHETATMEDRGVYADPYVDLPELMDWKDEVVDGLTGGVEGLLGAAGVTVVDGTAAFGDDAAVEVTPAGGEAATVAFEHTVVATGSRPIELPGFPFDAGPVLSSRDALAMETVPNRVVVVGAGYIGMELSTVLAGLGTEVTVVEALASALPAYADDLTAVVQERAEELGIEFRFETSAADWSETPDGCVELTTETTDGERDSHVADRLLVAVGREPVAETVDPGAAGIETTESGFIDTDDHGRTAVEGVYAVGDVAGEPMLAHAASFAGAAVAETIDGSPTPVDGSAVPAAVFTEPEIATVGLTPDEATAEGYAVSVGRFPLSASGRALAAGESEGFVRVVVDRDRGTVLGGQIVGANASELIAEIGLAVEAEIPVDRVAGTVHTHPTVSEAVKEACEQAVGRAVHTTN